MALLFIDEDACTGCGICLEVCPLGALDLVESVAVVNEKCNACNACVPECPVDALSLPEAVVVAPDLADHRGVWVWVEQVEQVLYQYGVTAQKKTPASGSRRSRD